jgi:hypothetical protein
VQEGPNTTLFGNEVRTIKEIVFLGYVVTAQGIDGWGEI